MAMAKEMESGIAASGNQACASGQHNGQNNLPQRQVVTDIAERRLHDG
ncbi:MAG: hypothetical protein HKL96_13370 [Phycisphaerales bacterium]|nr:hypothetical protein [Phycisphaerales bacterium]